MADQLLPGSYGLDYPGLADFLSRETAAVLAVPIDEAGTVHAAGILYYHQATPLRFYFVTPRSSDKCTLLRAGGKIKAACVVGTIKGVDFTLQMRGTLEICDYAQLPAVVDAYYEKRGNRDMDVLGEDDYVLLQFVPTWGRFTDYTSGYDHRMLRIEDS